MFDLTFLGTAASTPSAERGLPALLVNAGGERFLVDCGEGTTRQLLRARSGFRRLGHVLLTHDDLDHVLGLGGLVASLDLAGRRRALAICGSAQTLAFVERYLASLWPQGRPPLPLRFIALTPGATIAGIACRIDCFPVRHRGPNSLGYRFATTPHRHLIADRLAALGVPAGPLRARLAKGEAIALPDGRPIDPESVRGPPLPGASLAVVGDAEETATLLPAIRGVDALVIEATFLETDAALAAERGHLTAAQAGRLAAEAGVGALHLTHLSGRYNPNAVAAEAGRFFPRVRVMNDLDRVTVTAAPRPA